MSGENTNAGGIAIDIEQRFRELLEQLATASALYWRAGEKYTGPVLPCGIVRNTKSNGNTYLVLAERVDGHDVGVGDEFPYVMMTALLDRDFKLVHWDSERRELRELGCIDSRDGSMAAAVEEWGVNTAVGLAVVFSSNGVVTDERPTGDASSEPSEEAPESVEHEPAHQPRPIMGHGHRRAPATQHDPDRPVSPLDSFRALFTILKRAKLPEFAAGFDDHDYAAAVAEIASRSDSDRATWHEAVRGDLSETIDATINDPKQHERVKGLLATLPVEMLDYVCSLVAAIDHGAARKGAPSFFDPDSVAPEVRVRAEAAAETRIDDIVIHGTELANAQRGLIVVPGFTWLFGAGIHVFRAFAFLFFWIAGKVRLNQAIIWIPIWILAAAADFVTFSLPWVFFAVTARLVRGDTSTNRTHDRIFGCWCFGTSKRARLDHARLRRLGRHRVFVDEGLLIGVPAALAIRSAALAEVGGTKPVVPSAASAEKVVTGAEQARWWAPRGAAALYFVVLVIFFATSGHKRTSGSVASSDQRPSDYQYRPTNLPNEMVVPADPRTGKALSPLSPPTKPAAESATATTGVPDHCSIPALKCEQFSGAKNGRKVGEAIQKARTDGHNEEAICLAQTIDSSGCLQGQDGPCTPDARLAGAAFYEQAQAWKAMGCLEAARTTVASSLDARPHGGRAWHMTCDLCKEIGGGTCDGCSGLDLKPDDLIKAEHAAIEGRDAHAFAALASQNAFSIGLGANEVSVGRDQIEAQLRNDLGATTAGKVKVRSRYLNVGRELEHAWIAEELELTDPDGSSKHIALSQLAVSIGGTWSVVAMHWSVPLANDAAYESASRGDLPVPTAMEVKSADKAGLGDVLRTYLASPKSVADAFADRDDAFNFGSAPGERVVGATVKRALGAMRAKMQIHDGVVVGTGTDWDPGQAESPWIGWGAANVDFTVTKGGKSITETFRLLAVLTYNVSGKTGWQIVQTHWSNPLMPTNPGPGSGGGQVRGDETTSDGSAGGTAGTDAERPASLPKPSTLNNECKEERVDNKDGTFDVVKKCKPANPPQ